MAATAARQFGTYPLGSSEPKTSPPIKFGGRWTAAKSMFESCVTRSKKFRNKGDFKIIRIGVISPCAFDSEHTSEGLIPYSAACRESGRSGSCMVMQSLSSRLALC
jgi:hypothetical protein